MSADHLVKIGVVDSISDETVRQTLKNRLVVDNLNIHNQQSYTKCLDRGASPRCSEWADPSTKSDRVAVSKESEGGERKRILTAL